MQVVIGVVHNPILDEMYTAVRGGGAFLNGDPIQASACTQLGAALAITEVGVTRDDETLRALFGRMSALAQKVGCSPRLHQGLCLALRGCGNEHLCAAGPVRVRGRPLVHSGVRSGPSWAVVSPPMCVTGAAVCLLQQ